MPLSRLALALVLTVLLTGCVSNMDELKIKLGAAEAPPTYLPPLARATANTTTALVETPLRFTADGSKDPQNLPLLFVWRFGDATTAQGAEVLHAFDKAGEYTVRLSVANQAGLVDDATLVVRIAPGNHRPVAAFDITPAHAKMGDKVAFDAGRSTDADGDALTYAWDFGDGSTALAPQATHAYPAPGLFTARLRVTDPSGAVAEATRVVTVDGAWSDKGKFELTASDPHTTPIVVVDGAKRLSATLTFPAGVGNDLALVAKDAAGHEVARSAAPATGAPAKPDQPQARTIDVPADKLAAAGAWTIVVEDKMAPAGAEWALTVSETF